MYAVPFLNLNSCLLAHSPTFSHQWFQSSKMREKVLTNVSHTFVLERLLARNMEKQDKGLEKKEDEKKTRLLKTAHAKKEARKKISHLSNVERVFLKLSHIFTFCKHFRTDIEVY